ncbi:hypothetical protein AB0G05_41020, partial [Nonomuraea wenchangensis]
PYAIARAPWLAAPFALFALTALAQLVAAALKGRALAAYGGLCGVAFAGLTAQAVHGLTARNATALAVGLPADVVPYTWIAVASVVLTAAGASLRWRRWPGWAATAVGAGFLVWWVLWVT